MEVGKARKTAGALIELAAERVKAIPVGVRMAVAVGGGNAMKYLRRQGLFPADSAEGSTLCLPAGPSRDVLTSALRVLAEARGARCPVGGALLVGDAARDRSGGCVWMASDGDAFAVSPNACEMFGVVDDGSRLWSCGDGAAEVYAALTALVRPATPEPPTQPAPAAFADHAGPKPWKVVAAAMLSTGVSSAAVWRTLSKWRDGPSRSSVFAFCQKATGGRRGGRHRVRAMDPSMLDAVGAR